MGIHARCKRHEISNKKRKLTIRVKIWAQTSQAPPFLTGHSQNSDNHISLVRMHRIRKTPVNTNESRIDQYDNK